MKEKIKNVKQDCLQKLKCDIINNKKDNSKKLNEITQIIANLGDSKIPKPKNNIIKNHILSNDELNKNNIIQNFAFRNDMSNTKFFRII